MRSRSERANNRNTRIRVGPGKHILPETTQAAFERAIACSRRIASKGSRRKRTVDLPPFGFALTQVVETVAYQTGGEYATCFSIA
jgi:hypothetical protein